MSDVVIKTELDSENLKLQDVDMIKNQIIEDQIPTDKLSDTVE